MSLYTCLGWAVSWAHHPEHPVFLAALPLPRHPASWPNVAYRFRPIVFFMTLDCPAGWLEGGGSFSKYQGALWINHCWSLRAKHISPYDIRPSCGAASIIHCKRGQCIELKHNGYWGSLKAHGWTERKQRFWAQAKVIALGFFHCKRLVLQHLAVIQSTCKIPHLSKQVRGFRAITAGHSKM